MIQANLSEVTVKELLPEPDTRPCTVIVFDGRVYTAITIINKGEPSYTGRALLHYFGTSETAQLLCAYGDLSQIIAPDRLKENALSIEDGNRMFRENTSLLKLCDIEKADPRNPYYLYLWNGNNWSVDGMDLDKVLASPSFLFGQLERDSLDPPKRVDYEKVNIWDDLFKESIRNLAQAGPHIDHIPYAAKMADLALTEREKRFGNGFFSAGRYGRLP